jgi:hypothetical protein
LKPAANGEHLWKRVHVKVIHDGKIMCHEFVAPAGRGYRLEDIEEQKEKIIEFLDQKFARTEFKLVQLNEPNKFNFISIGGRT